ncbi:MAG: hypothetical protein DMG13_02005 [Acidobacteria bacterium]|nr:MAG: hypothetical protein DMG13_02005 [Acidobacteriota bacterium]
MFDVIVIGGGVIGLSIARELAGRRSVMLLDRGATGEGASWAAAGMLSPMSEADDQGPLFQLCRASFELFRRFVEDLREESGIDAGYCGHGVLLVGFDVELLTPEDVRKMEPLVTAPIVNGLFMSGERSVAPRRLVTALREACLERGVEIRTGVRVNGISQNAVFADRTNFEASSIVVASGVWSADLRGLDPPLPVYPRKGQILSLGMPAASFRHMIRWQHAYFIPRRTGELVVGATDEDAGFDGSVTVAGLGRLLADAQAISSHVGTYPILETWTGLRPATPDGLPILGPAARPGVYYAAGHYRNGILLAPITASIIRDLVENRRPAVSIDAYAPSRFAK